MKLLCFGVHMKGKPVATTSGDKTAGEADSRRTGVVGRDDGESAEHCAWPRQRHLPLESSRPANDVDLQVAGEGSVLRRGDKLHATAFQVICKQTRQTLY